MGPFGALGVARGSADNRPRLVSEYEVKAAFLYNVAKFIEWPSPDNRRRPMVLGVVGDDPFGSVLDQTLSEKTVRGRKFQIKRFPTIRELELCQILFINLADKNQLKAVLSVVKDTPVLTVGESADFMRLGGVVRLVLKNERVRFEINAGAAEQAGLKISSQLLKLAHRVRGG